MSTFALSMTRMQRKYADTARPIKETWLFTTGSTQEKSHTSALGHSAWGHSRHRETVMTISEDIINLGLTSAQSKDAQSHTTVSTSWRGTSAPRGTGVDSCGASTRVTQQKELKRNYKIILTSAKFKILRELVRQSLNPQNLSSSQLKILDWWVIRRP